MRAPRLIIIRRRLGWYWRLVARNGRILAVGAEPFASERNARRAFKTAARATRSYGVAHACDIEWLLNRSKHTPHDAAEGAGT